MKTSLFRLFSTMLVIFFKERGIKYHIIRTGGSALRLCVNLDENEDSYALFSRFFGKFDALVKTN